jgi:hypothetical protein
MGRWEHPRQFGIAFDNADAVPGSCPEETSMIALAVIGFVVVVIIFTIGVLLFLIGGPTYSRERR